ncbi:MAG: hypothetical protein ACT4OT_08450 [Acidobacteriota bacterium]
MNPQKIRTLASALLIFSLISVSLATGAGNAAPQKRSVVLTARITDESGTPIPGAHISIFQGEQHLGQGDADARGIVQVNITVDAAGAVELVLEVSKPGMETKAHKMKLGTNFPARLPIEEIQLKTGVSRTGVVLTVKVVDEKGAPIQQALVNLYFKSVKSWTLADVAAGILNSLPRDLQDTTGVNGMAKFTVPLRVGESKSVAIEVSREDKKSEVRTVEVSEGSLDRLETFTLNARVEDDAKGLPSANIKVKVVDQDGANLEGALVAVSSGAWTPSVSNKPHQKSTGPDGSATIAVELMSADTINRFSILASKPGYKRGQQTNDGLEIDNKWGRAQGQTFEAKPIMLIKAPSAIGVKVVVLDGDTNNGVPDAEVVLNGPDFATATTDTSGVAPLSVEKPGTYKVRISQDTYWPTKDAEIRVVAGVAPEPVEFRLRRKPTKDAARDTIDITVLAKDSIDDNSPKPLKGAAVTDGRGTDYTDDNGQVQLRGAFDRATDITVSANDYKTLTKRVPINKPLIGSNTGNATFVLDPAASDNNPIRLIVDVRDATNPDRRLDKADVILRFNKKVIGTAITGESGEAEFTLRDSTQTPLKSLRTGIRVDVRRDSVTGASEDYKPTLSDIAANRLEPSLEPKRVMVLMHRDWTALIKAIEALEPKVFAWNKDLKADANAAFQTFRDMATAAVERAKALENEITAPFLAISFVANGTSLCGQAAPYLIRIPNLAAQVKQKEQELKQKIDRAEALAQTCSTLNDPELIRSGYRDAVRLLGEMGSLEKQAVADRNALLEVAKQNSAALAVIRQAKQRLPELPKLQALAEENLKTAVMRAQTQSDLSKTLISRQLTLKAELSVLSVKAFSEVGVPDELRERIIAMDGILSAKSKGSQAPELIPKSVEEAPVAVRNINEKVARMITALDAATCPVATLDDVVEGMSSAVYNSGIEIGLAADLPKLADACAAKAANKTTPPPVKPTATPAPTSNPGTTNKSDPPIVQDDPAIGDKTVNDPTPGDKTTNSPNTTNTTKTTKTTQPTAPNNSNTQPTSSGGFWDTAKKSGKNVKDTITNKPTTGGNNTAANRDPNSGNKPNNKPANTPLTVEDIPEDTTTTVAVNKPASGSGGKNPPVVEDIPEDATPTVTSNKPKSRSGSAPVVEEIPEDATTIASNKPGSNSPPVVEEIPETAPPINSGSDRGSGNSSSGGKEKLPPNVRRNKDGRLVPKDGYEWVNPNDPNDTRVQKKPRDPNKPDFWTQLGGAINQAITGQPPVTNQPGGNTNPPVGGGGGLNLAGTWSVTTVSSGDDEMQQNFTRTNVWHVWDEGGGRWRVRQVINGQTFDEIYTTVDYGGGSFRLSSTFGGETHESSGTYNQSQFQVSSSKGQNRITITGTRQ